MINGRKSSWGWYMTDISSFQTIIVDIDTWFTDHLANQKANYSWFWVIFGSFWANNEFKKRINRGIMLLLEWSKTMSLGWLYRICSFRAACYLREQPKTTVILMTPNQYPIRMYELWRLPSKSQLTMTLQTTSLLSTKKSQLE